MIEIDSVFSISNEQAFESRALDVFNFQRQHCLVYRDYLTLLNRPEPNCIEEIPFLPISFFRTHKVMMQGEKVEKIFKSSGTTDSERSQHFLADLSIYKKSFEYAYRKFIGNPEEQVILALLPNYLEQGDSSLVFMVDYLIHQSKHDLSGFLLGDLAEVHKRYNLALEFNKKPVIIGVSYALLDLAEKNFDFSKVLVIETGGMKGRRKEMVKEELHELLQKGLNVTSVGSEYGMTELLSQAYSLENGIFQTPPWMKIMIRDIYDPFIYEAEGKIGAINVIDLANIYSCSFIATDDLGRKFGDQFSVSGRMDRSIQRGCNLLV
jgi:phenylacetate-coenzyme A ligase PaaK-like adenylate-forming protein